MKKHTLKITLAVLAILLLAPVSILAYSQNKELVLIPEDENIDRNFYATGERIVLDGNVAGDMIAAASIIEINGRVEGDVIAAAGQMVINGEVGGSVIAAAGKININGKVGENVRLAAGEVTLGSTIGKSALAAAGSINLLNTANIAWSLTATCGVLSTQGTVRGHLDASCGEVTLNGTVLGDVKAKVSEGLTMQKNAKVEGNLSYFAPSESSVDTSKVLGTVKYELLKSPVKNKGYFIAVSIMFWIINTIAMIVIGGILTLGFKKCATDLAENFWVNPWKHMGIGMIFLIVTPIIAVILMLTLIGIPLALILLALYAIMWYLGYITAGLAIGAKILKRLDLKSKQKPALTWPLVIGVILISLVSSIPFIGWIFCFVLSAWGFANISTVKRMYWNKLKE